MTGSPVVAARRHGYHGPVGTEAGAGTFASLPGALRALARVVGGFAIHLLDHVIGAFTPAAPDPRGDPGLPGRPPEGPTSAAGPQAVVEEAKFFLGPEPASARMPAMEDAGDLPAAYGQDRIGVLVRDPWTLFVHWELTPRTRITALRQLGADAEGTREVLRVVDVSDTTTGDLAGSRGTEVDIPPGADSRYVPVDAPDRRYRIELGLRTAQGRFLPLLSTHGATTPPAAAATDSTVVWATVQSHGAPIPAARSWNGGRLDVHASPAPDPERPRSSDQHA